MTKVATPDLTSVRAAPKGNRTQTNEKIMEQSDALVLVTYLMSPNSHYIPALPSFEKKRFGKNFSKSTSTEVCVDGNRPLIAKESFSLCTP